MVPFSPVTTPPALKPSIAATADQPRNGSDSERTYEGVRDATAYLLRSPANARRLLDSIENLEHGRGTQHDLVED